MAKFWPSRNFLVVVLLVCAYQSHGKKTEKETGGLDALKAKQVHKAVSTLLEHKIGKKLKEAAKEVKHAVDAALGKHLDKAHHMLNHKEGDDVVVMDPKLSKLVKNAVKDGKKQHKDKKAKAHAHDNPPPSHFHAGHHGAHQARRPMGYQSPYGNQFGAGGYGTPQPGYPQRTPYPQRPGYPPMPGTYQQSPQGYGQRYPASSGVQARPGYPAPGYPPMPSPQGQQQYGAQQPNGAQQPYDAQQSFAAQQPNGAQQSPYMANGCPQACNQNCPIMCPRKCCSDKREEVAHNKKSKVHHEKHSKKRARIHRKKHHKHH